MSASINPCSQETLNKSISTENDVIEIKVTGRRWLILFIFASVSGMNAFHWIQHNIIQDVMLSFYNESLPGNSVTQNEAVNWLSLVYMLAYIPLVFPTMFLLDRKGLKYNVSIGAFLTCVGAWVKCGAVSPDRFWVLMLGQTLCAIAQAFTLGVPAQLSSLWFGPTEISTATSIGVFGNQLGTAVGFILPPFIISTSLSTEAIIGRLYSFYFSIAGICTMLFVLSVIVIKNKPDHPPNPGQINEYDSSIGIREFFYSMRNLFKNRNFLLTLFSYGINTGSYYAISTLLNQIVLSYFSNETEKSGYIGLILVLSGLFGAIIGGVVLDRTKAFKLITFLMYILSLLSMILFTFTIQYNIFIPFGTAFLLGFFMTGYLPVGFEFAAELTYPEPEGTSSGLLNTSAQIFGIGFTYAQGRILTTIGVLYSNIFLCSVLAFGTILTVFTTSDLRRQRAFKSDRKSGLEEEKEEVKSCKLSTMFC